MDKNFIDIDDLVRQRLTGGEERERSGAWLRMRELLDKEEERKPVGFLYWRHIFGAVAFLVALSAISVGGYRMSAAGGSHSPAHDYSLASGPANEAAGTGSSDSHSAIPAVAAGTEPGKTNKENNTPGGAGKDNILASTAATTGNKVATATGHTKASAPIASNNIAAKNNTPAATPGANNKNTIAGNERSKALAVSGANLNTHTAGYKDNTESIAVNNNTTAQTSNVAPIAAVNHHNSSSKHTNAHILAANSNGPRTLPVPGNAQPITATNPLGAADNTGKPNTSSRKGTNTINNTNEVAVVSSPAQPGNTNTATTTTTVPGAVSGSMATATKSNTHGPKTARKTAKNTTGISGASSLASGSMAPAATTGAVASKATHTQKAAHESKTTATTVTGVAKMVSSSSVSSQQPAATGIATNKKLHSKKVARIDNAAPTKAAISKTTTASSVSSQEQMATNNVARTATEKAPHGKKAATIIKATPATATVSKTATSSLALSSHAPGAATANNATAASKATHSKKTASVSTVTKTTATSGKTGTSASALSSRAPSTDNNVTARGAANKAARSKKATSVATTTSKVAMAGKTGASSMAVSSHATVVAPSNATLATATKTAHSNSSRTTGASKTASANATRKSTAIAAATTSGASGALSGQPSKINSVPGANATQDGNDDEDSDDAIAYAKKDNMVIEKMQIIQRHMKTSPDNLHYDLDTISVLDFTREYAATADDAATTTRRQRRAARKAVAANTPFAATPGNTNTPATTATANTTTNTGVNQQMLAANTTPALAGKTSAAKPALGAKPVAEGSVKEMGASATGSEKIANLNQAFNDIKYKVGAARFAPSLTAGINGTFFGPSSFKGFQFGFAGDFIFGDTWSIMAELKYFHRINDNYTLNDYYYSNVQGVKTLELNSYGFSTLHSFELPISARYHVGNFNFYGGPNFAYSLAINPGANPAVAVTGVAAPAGTENSPKLNINDFAPRFGVGYLCGLTYQATPNVSFDFRNVQTVWDNSKSDGAKFISSQLYKSPSLQLSILYRLGGNKGKK